MEVGESKAGLATRAVKGLRSPEGGYAVQGCHFWHLTGVVTWMHRNTGRGCLRQREAFDQDGLRLGCDHSDPLRGWPRLGSQPSPPLSLFLRPPCPRLTGVLTVEAGTVLTSGPRLPPAVLAAWRPQPVVTPARTQLTGPGRGVGWTQGPAPVLCCPLLVL